MDKDQKEGRFEHLKGRIKEAAGKLSGDKQQEAEGATERGAGSVKKAFGDLKEKITKKLEH
jgi:uncharacterized protein YjbJ (UPF0337 family)